MNYRLSEILDVEQVSELLKSYTDATGLVSALLDLDGNILSQSGWQRICTDFHRVNPDTAANCRTSDTTLANKLVEGGEFNVYKCLNGLVDVAVPLKVNEHHIGNLFTGQFLMEKPNISYFEKQAKKYNFDKHKYLESLQDIPILKIEEIRSKLNFLLQMTRVIAELGLAKIKQIEAIDILKSSELKFKRLSENSPAIIYQFKKNLDGSYSFPYISESVENALNIRASDVISDVNILMNLIHPDDRDDNNNAIEESANKLLKYTNELRFILPSGITKWIEASSAPEKQEDGSILWNGFFQDITDRKRAEEATKESEEKFKSSFYTSPVAQAILTQDGKIIESNNAFSNLIGFSKEKIIGSSVVDLGLLSLAEREKLASHAKKSGGTIRNAEVIFTAQDGSFRNVLYSTEQILLNGVPHRLSIGIDITDRKQAEKNLIESEKQYRSLFENMNTGFVLFEVILNAKGVPIDLLIVTANRGFEKTTGLNLKDAAGKHLTEVLPGIEKDEADWIGTYAKVALSGESAQFEQGSELLGFYYSISAFQAGPKQCAVTFLDITEQKRTYEALKKSEERSRSTLDSMLEGCQLIGFDWKYIYLNGTAEIHNRRSNKELLGKRYMDVWPGIEQTKVFRIIRQTMETRVDNHLENEFEFPDGSHGWFDLSIQPVPEGVFILSIDITERKKAEEALSHSHDLMKYIIEHNQTSVAVLDRNLKYLYVSQHFISEYRVKEKNIIGKHHFELFPEIPEKWRKIHQMALNGIVSRADEDMFYRNDGTFDWTRWECRPWYEADDMIGGIILYLEVISEQKQKELEIKKLNERLEILISSVQQLAAALSIDTVQDIVAKSARKLIGADGATLVFRENDNCFYVNEDAIQPLWKGKKFPMNTCISGWVMENKKSAVIEDIFVDDRISKDDYSPTFVKSLAMVPININEPIGAIGNYWKESHTPTETEMQLLQTLADATARAIENIQLYSELEDRVKQRTKQLQTVNKELEAFTYSVSHDLRAPLRHISGYVDLMNKKFKDELPDKAEHYLNTIQDSAQTLGTLIDELLQFSRTGRQELQYTKVNLNEVIRECINMLTIEIGERQIKWTIETLPTINADKRLMILVWQNLIANAIKFTRKVVESHIYIGVIEEETEFIFFIQDNGVGFDMKYASKLFGIFQRMHSQNEFEGTGIGLANVRRIISKHGGRTWAEAELNKGAKFYLTLAKSKI
ncbi:MAG: PAS domain S-box protein [Labilibaculum sp.]|nr:PAS domain S-box protein [Labilibaculum sp.]MBI9059096.1 PAS domain S-box protein [Labilibaculum sp.]